MPDRGVAVLGWAWVVVGLGAYLWQFRPLADAILRSLGF
jgi:hypothetical protein